MNALKGDRQLTVGKNGINKQEKRRWNRVIHLSKILKVERVENDKKNRRWIVRLKGKEYMFRAKNEQERDYWVKGLKETMYVIKESEQYHVDTSEITLSDMEPTPSPGPYI